MAAQANEDRILKDKEDVYSILHDIQVNIKVPKNQFNSFGRYNYRNCEDILEAVKKALPNHASVTIEDSIELVGDRHYVKSCARIHYKGNSVQSVAYAREPLSKKGMDESQITGASSSYARKYALNGLFLIDDSKDSDSKDNRESDKPIIEKPVNEKLILLKKLNDSIQAKGISLETIQKWKDHFKVDSLNKLNEKQINGLIFKINELPMEDKQNV